MKLTTRFFCATLLAVAVLPLPRASAQEHSDRHHRYKLIDFMRHRRRDVRRRVDLPLDDWLEIVDRPAGEVVRSTWEMDRHLAVLPLGQRKVVRAIAVEGGSVRSVAQQLATSEGVVRMTLHRAISRLLEAADATPTITPRSRNEHDKHR